MQKIVVMVIALGLCGVSPAVALAQAQQEVQTPATTTTENGTPTSADTADLAITSTVTARELRFQVVPNSKIEFSGSPERQTGWRTERVNLPKPVQSGVTYRDIGIRLQITSEFTDIQRIVRDALGEAPVAPQQSPITPGVGKQP